MTNNKNNTPIKYIENKSINQQAVDHYLSISAAANHWTNFGPLSHQLESRLSELFQLNDDLRVVACCNATVALHTLIAMQHTLHDKTLRWVTSAFGFYSSADGALSHAEIIDCDSSAMLDLNLLDPNSFDALIATNVFGQMNNMDKFRDYAAEHNKILVIDSAMGFQAGGHIANECISLHHTKPWGFGECGCAIVHKDHEKLFRSLISFGHDHYDDPINRLAVNGKISDIACAYVLMWLDQYDELLQDYNEQYQRIVNMALEQGLTLLANTKMHPSIPSNVPILLDRETKALPKVDLPIARYYYPLMEKPQARNIYNRIVNIACHRELKHVSDNNIIDALSLIGQLNQNE